MSIEVDLDGDSYIDTIYHSHYNIVTAIEQNNFSSIPSDFKLDQNYPNPFNPSTKIKYAIPQLSFITLKVYDILGREIETLVNTEKPAGAYVVKFDGHSLPSGVYFYRIQAGDFVDTKKFILLK